MVNLAHLILCNFPLCSGGGFSIIIERSPINIEKAVYTRLLIRTRR